MFSDVDDSLRELLTADMPIVESEVDVAFDRPTREWASRLTKPTINLFLADVRDQPMFRSHDLATFRGPDGQGGRQVPCRRIDLLYVVTAWTKEPADEHRILARALRTMLRHGTIPAGALRGDLTDASEDVLLHPMPPDHLIKPPDLWGVLDNELHASLTWLVTVPVDLERESVAPLVAATTVRFGQLETPGEPDRFGRVAGTVVRRGEEQTPVSGARVVDLASGSATTTAADGTFVLERVAEGPRQLRVEAGDAAPVEAEIVVPAPFYRLEV